MANAYVDNTNSIGNLTSATGWSFTNGSAAVTCPAAEGDANNEISAGDYVRAAGGIQWYKVLSVDAGGDLVTLTINFQQANVGPVACNYNDADGSAADGNAFVHPNQATTDSVRAAGEIVFLRANQTHVLAGINMTVDEDGTIDSPITLFGCDSVTDPWTDASDVNVIISFGDTAQRAQWTAAHYWDFENVDIQSTISDNGLLYFNQSYGANVTECNFSKNVKAANAYGVSINISGGISFYSCGWSDNRAYNVNCARATASFYQCALDGGGVNGTSRNFLLDTSTLLFEECAFGSVAACGVATFRFTRNTIITTRRCKFDDPAITENITLVDNITSALLSEDHDQAEGVYYAEHHAGLIEKDTGEADLGGGSDNTIKVTPNANTGLNNLLKIMEWEEQAVPKDIEYTRGVAIKVETNPGSYPSNAELYIEAEYYNHGTNDTTVKAVSTAVLAADTTWVWFPVVFTPLQTQKVRYRAYLGTQENAESYYIDNALYDADPT